MKYNLMERYYLSKLDRNRVPVHVAIIMDGNGRWGLKNAHDRSYGHKRGAETFETIADFADSIGIRYLTVFAFSTENWKRPKDEVDTIMRLLEEINQRGTTVIVVTHSQEMVDEMNKRVITMERGSIISDERGK